MALIFANPAGFLARGASPGPRRWLTTGNSLTLRGVDANPERDELLRAIVAADVALRPDRERFRVQRIESRAGQVVIHSGFNRLGDSDWRDCNRQDVEDLYAQGLIRLEKQKRTMRQRGGVPRTFWEEWFFDVTDAGFQKIEREHRAAAETDSPIGERPGGGYDWETEALPVLQAVYTASASAEADLGVSETTINEALGREPGDALTEGILTMLIRGDFLDTSVQTMGSRFCQITEKGLQITAGWPSGAADAAYTRLLALIDEHVEEAASDEERSKWQRLRDAVVGVGRDVAVDVLSAAAETGLRHIP